MPSTAIKETAMADQKALEQKYAPVGQVITDFSEYGTNRTVCGTRSNK